MISQQTIQEIQNRIDILDVVGNFVKLKRRGTNYLGHCPFHNEKSPSFTVSPAKEIYKCFGCGKSGNGIGFVMEHEKLTYPEALKWLANRYGIEIEETEQNPEYKEQQQIAESLHILNQFAAKYFNTQLIATEEGKQIALEYLKERGFNDATIEKFQIGYCPDHAASFTTEALKQQYSSDILKKSGLSIERNGQLIDNYRCRIIFPIHNQSGKIIGFGARVIGNNDRGPKYINTPENELYVKSKVLYGSFFARHPIDKSDECLLVEGYTDVTAMHQAGVENVVASGGTSLTPDQLRLIKKYSNNLTIIYDGDNAGIKAALRGLDLAIEAGLNVQLVLIPDKEDPDSYVKKIGAEAFKNFVKENKKDFILFQLDIALKDAGNDSTKKAVVVNQIAESISKLNRTEDFTRQQDYIKRCSHLLKIDEQGLTALVQKFLREKLGKEEKKIQREEASNEKISDPEEHDAVIDLLFKDELNEQAVLRALIEFGSKPWDEKKTVSTYIIEEIEKDGLEELFDNKNLIQMLQQYKSLLSNGQSPNEKYFLYHIDPNINQLAVSILTEKHSISPNWEKFYKGEISWRGDRYKDEVVSSMTYLKLKKINRLIFENQKELENTLSEDDMFILLKTHQHLKELEMDLMKNVGTVIFK